MKILMIAPTPFFADRGCHVRILEEAKALQTIGNKVAICTYHNGRDIKGLTIKRIINIPWYNKLEAGPSWHKLYLDFLLLIKTLIACFQEKPDIIHGHLHEGAWIGKICSLLFKKPVVFDCQGSLVGELVDHEFMKKNSMLHKIFWFMERLTYSMVGAIITSTSKTAQLIPKEFGIPEEKVSVIIDGVDTDVFHPRFDVHELREKLNIPQNRKIVVFLGLLNEYQGVDLLINAIPLVLKALKNIHFLIMGFPNVEKYKDKVKHLGVGEHVTFTGRINYLEAPRYLCLGEVAVSPKVSKTEANGKLLNYMACSLPSVVFNAEINREILGDLGVYPEYANVASLAEELIKLCSNDDLIAELSIKVREKAKRDYSWINVAKKIESVYKKT